MGIKKRVYLIRLDDACEYMDVDKWREVISILDEWQVCPLIGVIPSCKDKDFTDRYSYNGEFWSLARLWQEKKYLLAMHGFNHVCHVAKGGLNPVHKRSEFVGLSLQEQKRKIQKGIAILKAKGLEVKIFFAPSHTFDSTTLQALKEESDIRIISDTIAGNVYKKDDFLFLPCQMGRLRSMPFKFTSVSLHPNEFQEKDFAQMKTFLNLNAKNCVKSIGDIPLLERGYSLFDRALKHAYFSFRSIKRMIK